MQFTASVHFKNLGLIPTSGSDTHCLKENRNQGYYKIRFQNSMTLYDLEVSYSYLLLSMRSRYMIN